MSILPLFLLAASAAALSAAPVFTPRSQTVETYDYVEVEVRTTVSAGNPFLDAELTGELTAPGAEPVRVPGFCDSPDGFVFRIRFLAVRPGLHRYEIRFRSPREQASFLGTFTATPSKRRGLLRTDPQHPFHFQWEGTGEHFFHNGLTTYALMGWRDEEYIRQIIDRAARLKVNRLRVSLNGPRVQDASRWYEPVKPSADFRFLFGPWIGQAPDNVQDPGWDVTRFDTAFWQKYERLVRHARERDVVISVIFFLDGQDKGADPYGKVGSFSENEKRYYRYAAARLAAYSNVMWDVTNEWHLFRSAWWVEQMGSYLKSIDPWKHLISCHGRGEFPWMVSAWPDLSLFQIWDEAGGYEAMWKRRSAQAATGKPMPQVNEEYGYEDHYPVKWGGNRRPPARSADNRRRLAWEITMAGAYGTTGERANRGDGEPPATPGGWINGGFDSSMRMLEGYAHMVNFFESFDYWKLEPTPDAGPKELRILAEAGKQYVFYFPSPVAGEVKLQAGSYRSRWFNPRNGAWLEGPAVPIQSNGQSWALPAPPAPDGDWVLRLSAVQR